MPDWITHVAAAYFLAYGLKAEKKSLVVLGGLLPDLITKFTVFFRYVLPPDKLVGFDIFHTPLVALLVAITIAPVFSFDYRKSVALISAGIASHFLLDSLQGPVGYMVLWPFSWESYTLGIIWSENLTPLAVTLLIVGIIIIRKIKKNASCETK